MKQLFDEWYGEDKWCIAWDGAVERLARPGSKTNHAKAVEGVEEAWIGLAERGINVVFCPEGDRWSYYRDATKPDSTPVPYRGADKRRPRAQFDSEAAVQKALPDLVFADRGPCCGEARLCGKTVNGRLAVLSKSGDSDLLYIASRCWKVEECDDAPSGWACVLYDRDALLEHLGLGLDGLFIAFSEEYDVSNEARWFAESEPRRGRPKPREPRGRTGLGPCVLDGLLNEPGRTGPFSVAELFEGIKYVSDLPGQLTVGEKFRDALRAAEGKAFPPATADYDPLARHVAESIANYLRNPIRMTSTGNLEQYELVINELFDFAKYIVEESARHTPVDPPLNFDETMWDSRDHILEDG